MVKFSMFKMELWFMPSQSSHLNKWHHLPTCSGQNLRVFISSSSSFSLYPPPVNNSTTKGASPLCLYCCSPSPSHYHCSAGLLLILPPKVAPPCCDYFPSHHSISSLHGTYHRLSSCVCTKFVMVCFSNQKVYSVRAGPYLIHFTNIYHRPIKLRVLL